MSRFAAAADLVGGIVLRVRAAIPASDQPSVSVLVALFFMWLVRQWRSRAGLQPAAIRFGESDLGVDSSLKADDRKRI